MVENWEIEWNSSMLEHGRDLGTMEFIFAKGGTVTDMNYVMFDVQDNTWEPLIKAVAERDNSHPDIIRKQAEQQQEPFFMQSGQQGAQRFMGTGVRSPREANRQYNTAQRMANLSNYANNPTAMNALRAGKYGAAMGRGIMAGASKFKEGMQNRNQRRQDRQVERLGRAFDRDQQYQQNPTGMNALRAGRFGDAGRHALQAVKESGLGDRMKNFMGGAGRAISDLRHLPQAAKDSYIEGRTRREQNARRSSLEGGLGRAQTEEQQARDRYVPGSQLGDRNIDQALSGINERLSRDYQVQPALHERGKNKGMPKETVQDAMRREIQEIGAGQEAPREGTMARMRRMGDERRAINDAQQTAFAPSNVVPEEEPQPPALPQAPTPEAEEAANADAPTEQAVPEIDFGESPTEENPPNTGVVSPQPTDGETATITEDPSFGARFATDAQMKLGATAGDRVKNALDAVYQQHQQKPFANREAMMEAMMQAGIGSKAMTAANRLTGKTATAAESALSEIFGPAQAKQIVQSAQAGNQEAKQIVEQVVGNNATPEIDFADAMNMSEDEHVASWDSLLKGLNIR